MTMESTCSLARLEAHISLHIYPILNRIMSVTRMVYANCYSDSYSTSSTQNVLRLLNDQYSIELL